MLQINTPDCSQMFYEKTGSGPALVLIHGFPFKHDIWEQIAGDLSSGFTLIIPDLPGSGFSSLDGSLGIVEFAKCVKTILDKENIAKAVIAGHSMGGYVAFAFAALYPRSVSGLSVIHSTPLADDDEKKVTRKKVIDIIKSGGKKNFINQMIPNLFCDDFKQNHYEMVKTQIEKALESRDEALINFYVAMMERNDYSGTIDSFNFPIQWILGKNDNIIPYKKSLQYCFKTSVNFVHIFPSCGHMSMIEKPGQLLWSLTEFINYCQMSSL